MNRPIIVFAILACASAAHAQSAGAQAEVLFRQGRDLMAAGKYAEACTALQESNKLEPAVTTLLNLAGCREKLGQVATAWGLFLDAERQTRSATDAATQQLHDVASSHAKQLEPRVSKLVINVPQASQVDQLEIRRGQDRMDPAMWNRALPIDGGTYTITAHAPGTSDWSTTVTIAAEDDTKSVDIPVLQALPRPAVPSPAKAAASTTTGPQRLDMRVTTSGGHSKTVPIAVAAGAVVLGGAALGFSLSGDSTYNQAKAEMTDQARRDSLYNSANTKRFVAQGLGIAGLAGAGVAVWLFVRGSHDEHPGAATHASQVTVSPAGIAFSGVF